MIGCAVVWWCWRLWHRVVAWIEDYLRLWHGIDWCTLLFCVRVDRCCV